MVKKIQSLATHWAKSSGCVLDWDHIPRFVWITRCLTYDMSMFYTHTKVPQNWLEIPPGRRTTSGPKCDYKIKCATRMAPPTLSLITPICFAGFVCSSQADRWCLIDITQHHGVWYDVRERSLECSPPLLLVGYVLFFFFFPDFISIININILTYLATDRGFANLTRVPVLLVQQRVLILDQVQRLHSPLTLRSEGVVCPGVSCLRFSFFWDTTSSSPDRQILCLLISRAVCVYRPDSSLTCF